MRRKLASVTLCAIAMTCLMGAGVPPEDEVSTSETEPSVTITEMSQRDPEDGTITPVPRLTFQVSEGLRVQSSQTMLASSGDHPAVVEEALEQEAAERAAAEQAAAEQAAAEQAAAEQAAAEQAAAEQAAAEQAAAEEAARAAAEAAANAEHNMWIDGQNPSRDVSLTVKSGVPYVSLVGMSAALDSTATAKVSGSVTTVNTSQMQIVAKVGQKYVVANGRYLYLPAGTQASNGQVILPLSLVARIFDASLSWDGATAVLTRGSGALLSGNAFYNSNDLFWLSRVIYREAGNQGLDGQMAVGNVVLNRVASPLFPNTVEGVLAQKNQFSTYASGKLRSTNPSTASIVAAKLVMDGGVVEKTRGALWFDSAKSSWASRNKTCIATIGAHRFYK